MSTRHSEELQDICLRLGFSVTSCTAFSTFSGYQYSTTGQSTQLVGEGVMIPRTIFDDKVRADVDVARKFDGNISRRIDLNVRANADDSVEVFPVNYCNCVDKEIQYPGI